MNNHARIIIGDSRVMTEVADAAVDLVVTSPPYWHLKDYGIPGQVGYGQSLHQYLQDLYRVWRECFRVLRPGGRLCLNIGDQFARAAVYGRYQVIPLHAEFIAQCGQLGFDFLGAIIWQKKTTMNTTGGANVMGSYPYPPNGLIEIDYEFIQIFKKPGPAKKVLKEVKEASKLTKGEWKEYFSGHWHFGGVRQLGHEAMFPEELPRRLIKMFTFVGDTVLDPFLGSGTTVKVALELGRNALGYEINEGFSTAIQGKAGSSAEVEIIKGGPRPRQLPPVAYASRIQDASPSAALEKRDFTRKDWPRVVQVMDARTLRLDTGQRVGFLGVKIAREKEALEYLTKQVLGKKVRLVPADGGGGTALVKAYVYLKNNIFINTYLLKSGLGTPDLSVSHRLKNKFTDLATER